MGDVAWKEAQFKIGGNGRQAEKDNVSLTIRKCANSPTSIYTKHGNVVYRLRKYT